MAKKVYKYQPLAGAKLVGRRHVRDIPLPGLRELKNAFISKSDHAITMRPDFDPISEVLTIVGTGFTGDEATQDEYLNSASGFYGTTDIVFFSNIIPISWDGTSAVVACSVYTDGDVTGTSGSNILYGSLTNWYQNVWPGCYIVVGANTYKIDSVDSDTRLTLSENLETSPSSATYEIYRTHQVDHANYKINIQPFTSGIIYTSPTITMPVNAKKICGPFYASVVETSTEEVWVNMTDDGSIAPNERSRSNSVSAGAGNFMHVVNTNMIGGSAAIVQSSAPATDWAEVAAYPPTTNFSGDSCYGGGKFYFSCQDTANANQTTVCYTDDLGATWTKRSSNGSGLSGSSTSSGGIARNSSGRVVTYFQQTGDLDVAYSDDDFATWNEADTAGCYQPGLYLLFAAQRSDEEAFVGSNKSNGQGICYSLDGATWSSVPSFYAYNTITAGAYSTTGDFFLFGDSQGGLYKMSGMPSEWGYSSYSYLGKKLGATNTICDIVWAGDKFLVSHNGNKIYSTSDGLTYTEEHIPDASVGRGAFDATTRTTVFQNNASSSSDVGFSVSGQTQSTTSWRQASFEPLSDTYRSVTHSVLNGYVMLLGTREYQSTNSTWEYYPRRIRWSTPLTYNDFSSTGSGTADLDGSGAILDSRAVNGRIVTFESSQIGAISPRGYTNDPWEYDVIRDNIRAISNPVVVDDVCYFIDDAGLMRTTNGMTVDEPPFAFDLTEYDDFNSDIPVWLAYNPDLESLVIFNPAASGRYIYLIEIGSGSTSRIQVGQVANGGAALDPKSVVCVEHSSDRRMMVGYNPRSADSPATKLLVAELSTGSTITGIDEMTTTAADDTYHFTDIQTPEDWIVMEGAKTGIKHLIIRTYCDGTSEDTNPIVGIQVRSVEDSAWHDNGDDTGTITVDTDSCDGAGTAWSTTIGASGSTVYTTPCLATQARVYVGSTLQVEGTDYTITDTKEITFGSATADTVYAYWENEPFVRMETGDLIETTEGIHSIETIPTAVSATLDHYLSTGLDATATHIPAARMPVGDGEVKIGISKLTEGARFRFIIMADSAGDATVAKITGYSIGHLPAGEKIVEQ